MKQLIIFLFGVLLTNVVQSSQVFVSPYSFTLNPATHQLHTTWEVKGSSISFICAFAEVSLMELSWTGESKALSSGNSWAVNCEEGELGNKMVIEVDVTKFRVQPFRSYKVCISLEDSPTDSHLDEVCTHLFSFEKYVPYVPEVEEKEIKVNNDGYIEKKDESVKVGESDIDVKNENNKSETDILEHTLLPNSESKVEQHSKDKKVIANIDSIKHQLEDIENFVRDDFKSEAVNIEDKIFSEVNYLITHSGSESCNLSAAILICIAIIPFVLS